MDADQVKGMVPRRAFCAQLGITHRTAITWAGNGYGPTPRRLGPGRGRIFYVQSEIDAFVRDVKSRAAVVA